jgi:hypothetical protein
MTPGEVTVSFEERSRFILKADGPVYKVFVREMSILTILLALFVGVIAVMRNDEAFVPLEPAITAIAERWPRLADAVPILNSRVPGYGTKYGLLCVLSLLICLTWLILRWIPFAIRHRSYLHPAFPPQYLRGLSFGGTAFFICCLVILFHFEDIARMETSPSYSRPLRGSIFAYILVPGFVIPGITMTLSGAVIVVLRALNLHQRSAQPKR